MPLKPEQVRLFPHWDGTVFSDHDYSEHLRLRDEAYQRFTDLIEKVHRGDALTDAELDRAVSFYGQMQAGLDLLGPHFHLARMEVTRTYEALCMYCRVRSEDHR